MTTDDSTQLRESMWDLVYGLLSEEESQVLVARIKSEPDAARLYAEVRLEADLVAQAARVEDSSLSLKGHKLEGGSEVHAKAMGRSTREAGARLADFHRGARWLVALAATALAGLLALGLSWQRTSPPQLASALIAADVIASQPMVAGLTCPVEVRTYAVNFSGEASQGAPANVELQLIDRAGKAQFKKDVQTNEIGRATLDLPGEALEPGVRLQVAARRKSQMPAGAAGERVAQPAEATAGNAVATAAELPVQPEPQIAYFLCAEPMQQPPQQVPYAEWCFNAFTAKPAPPEAAQNAVAAAAGAVANEQRSPTLSTNEAFQYKYVERPNTQLRALSDKVTGSKSQSYFKSQAAVPADQPITVTVPEQLEGKQVRVAAMNRGVNVATQMVAPPTTGERKGRAQTAADNKAHSAAEQLSLALPPEADGLVEVQLFDQSKSQEEPVERQYVVRQPRRRLQIDVPDARARYAPGEEVALTLRCTDESGKPATDTRLGVRVWSEKAIQQSGEEPVLLADAVDYGLGEVVQNAVAPAQQAAMPSSQSDVGPKPAAEPAVGQAVELVTNRELVKSAILSAAASSEMARQRAIGKLGGAAIIGGVAVLMLLIMLAVLRLSIGWRTMTPGFVIAMASLLIGLGWIGWWPAGQFAGGVAMAPAAPAPSIPTHGSEAATTQHSDQTVARLSAQERDEPSPAVGGTAPPLAASSAPTPTAASGPAVSLAESAAAAKPGSSRVEARSRLAATPPPAQRYEQTGGPIVTLQAQGGQQARAFNFAKDSETESLDRRIPAEAAGVGGGAAATTARATLAEQLRREPEAGEKAKEQPADRAAGKPQVAAAPSSLYFNPQLMTDSEGKATIRFTMPPVEAEYRLLVDALGQGRIGSQQQTITSGRAPSK